MFDSLFTVENLLNVLGTFVYLFGELFLLFVAISFFVALLQVWVSKDRIKRILSRPHKVTNAILGAALGAVTPFCSCSTIPVLVGLFKSGAPFSGAISFLMTSPILNPARVLRSRANGGLRRHYLRVRGMRGARARRDRVLALHQERCR